MENKKPHYSKVLKDRIAKLEEDLYKIIDGDVFTVTVYRGKRKFSQDFEKVVWFGSVTKDNTNEGN